MRHREPSRIAAGNRVSFAQRDLVIALLALLVAACGSSANGPVCQGDSCAMDSGIPDAQASDAAQSDACVGAQCEPASCPALLESGACPPHRLCETTSGGPVCREACEAGYLYDSATSNCTACATPDCLAPERCDDVSRDSVATQCADAHRLCEDRETGAACGACVDGFRAEGDACVDELLCGDRVCGPEEMPVRDGDTCACLPRSCGAGEAERPDGSCRTCELSCAGQGETGRPYPKTDQAGACLCEPLPGFFWPLGDAARALPCDEDGDGWITHTAHQAYVASDMTIREIATNSCVLREVDRVILRNEYGQKLTVWSCQEGLGLTCEGAIAALPLVEPDRNDSADKLHDAGDEVPDVLAGSAGRALLASELNALTKACVSALADFDDDGVPDLTETQTRNPESLLQRWSAFAHFVELHRAHYEAPATLSALGSFVIEERSRCAGDFPMDYEASESDYWLECARRRDARFDGDQPAAGFDFAAWSCQDESTGLSIMRGSCPVPVPPVRPRPGVSDAPPHGLCELTGAWDQAWRGMHHHSQFKCVLVSEDDLTHAVSIQDVRGRDAYLDFQRCHARSGEGFDCTAFPPSPNTVGWAAVRYETVRKLPTADGLVPVNEVLGCVDEAKTWSGLCPGDQPDHVGTVFKSADADDFGRLICGCGDLERDYFADQDGDGFGDAARPTRGCEPPAGHVLDARDCNDQDPAVNPAFADSPDAENRDSNCDGIDGDLAHSVFVEASRGDDRREGRTPGQAVKTLTRGMELALACSPKPCDVLVAEGDYPQTRTLRVTSGVSMYGGYTGTFARTRDASAVRVFGTVNPLVIAERIERITTIDRMTFTGLNMTGLGEDSVTVRVLETAPDLLAFSNDVVVAGSGGPGARGADAGVTGCDAGGGAGATSADCGSNTGGRGWAGGDSQNGGYGGGGGASNCPDACPNVGGDAISGGNNGQGGGNGANAGSAPGTDANTAGVFVGAEWFPSAAPAGYRGAHGTGGGGGGSGGTKRFRHCFGCGTLYGATGGNGGRAGCGGGGGGGGTQGGASIGVVLYNASASLAGTRIVRGSGGVGGGGGNGSNGSGGSGGSNGEGTRHQCCGAICYNSGSGGAGGAGGAGGSGGGGVGGNGGPAFGVTVIGAASQLSDAPVVEGGAPGAGGVGGSGGSNAAAGPIGRNGALEDVRRF